MKREQFRAKWAEVCESRGKVEMLMKMQPVHKRWKDDESEPESNSVDSE